MTAIVGCHTSAVTLTIPVSETEVASLCATRTLNNIPMHTIVSLSCHKQHRVILNVCVCTLTVYEAQPAITAIYFWSYMIVAYFIIFNMILAVIFNVYNKKTEALEIKYNVEVELKAQREAEDIRKMQ